MENGSSSYRSRIAPGTRLSGIYEVGNVIAAGGMGEVYKGHTIETGDTVAIKVMLPEFAENDAAMALFRKEASALHNLQHDAIVRYYIFAVEPVLRRPYLAMEFVEGRPLSEILKQGPLTFEAVQTLRQRLAAGLQAAHERGIIHRDVSPDNVIIPGGDVGRAKIIDFGIARSSVGREGTVIGSGFAGKINYVSPEQLGLFGGEVTGKCDIYSLGVLLVEALTGRPIDLGGSQVDIIEKRRKVPDLGAIDLRVRPLIEKMLQPAPEKRPNSMAEVAAWQVGASHQYGGRYESGAHRDPRGAAATPGRRRGMAARLAVTGALALLLMAGAGGAYYYFGLGPVTPTLKQTPPPTLGGSVPPTSQASTESGRLATGERPSAPSAPALAPTPARPGLAAPTLTPAPSPSASALAPEAATSVATPPSASTATPVPATSPSSILPTTPNLTPAKPQVALLSPTITPAPAERTGRIIRYIDNYEGGDCFHIFPVAVTANAARIEGYGATVAPFLTLNEAFKTAAGFEADIGVRQITTAQCPALTFLSRLRGNRAITPRITIEATNLKSGQTLSGVIDNFGNRHIELLLIADDGIVHNVTRLLKPAAEGRSFNLRLERTGVAGAQPQLLIAVASTQLLAGLSPSSETHADQFFPRILAEAERTKLALGGAAKYFKLE